MLESRNLTSVPSFTWIEESHHLFPLAPHQLLAPLALSGGNPCSKGTEASQNDMVCSILNRCKSSFLLLDILRCFSFFDNLVVFWKALPNLL